MDGAADRMVLRLKRPVLLLWAVVWTDVVEDDGAVSWTSGMNKCNISCLSLFPPRGIYAYSAELNCAN